MLKETKITLKKLSKEIRNLKNKRPLKYRGDKSIDQIDSIITGLKYQFRHLHIAYCELRGRKRNEIEKPCKWNKTNDLLIERIKKEILDKFENKSKLYVLVRKDLERSSPAVQAGHCLAEFCLKSNLSKDWANQTLIYLQVSNLEELNKYQNEFKENEIEINTFHEPDLNNELTAICGLVRVNKSKFLSELKLLV